jgi:hypothetical protein
MQTLNFKLDYSCHDYIDSLIISGSGNIEIVKNFNKSNSRSALILLSPITAVKQQELQQLFKEMFILPAFIPQEYWVSFIDYYINSRKVRRIEVKASKYWTSAISKPLKNYSGALHISKPIVFGQTSYYLKCMYIFLKNSIFSTKLICFLLYVYHHLHNFLLRLLNVIRMKHKIL